jgi:hypothetical protein
MARIIGNVNDLKMCHLAYELARDVFEMSKNSPKNRKMTRR